MEKEEKGKKGDIFTWIDAYDANQTVSGNPKNVIKIYITCIVLRYTQSPLSRSLRHCTTKSKCDVEYVH